MLCQCINRGSTYVKLQIQSVDKVHSYTFSEDISLFDWFLWVFDFKTTEDICSKYARLLLKVTMDHNLKYIHDRMFPQSYNPSHSLGLRYDIKDICYRWELATCKRIDSIDVRNFI